MLSKAEAAAVYTARSMLAIFKEDKILPVCDVGGGTTDLSVFRVKNNTLKGSPHLEKIDVLCIDNIMLLSTRCNNCM